MRSLKSRRLRLNRFMHRSLERLESRCMMAVDLDDSFGEATVIGSVSTSAIVRSGAISPADDVDMYRLSISAGQTIDIDVDTALNGPGGLGSYLRLFNAQGQELAFNDNGSAPGEPQANFDAYIRYTFPTAGTFYVGVSNFNNTDYNPSNGNGDISTGQFATGNYDISFKALPVDTDDTLVEATLLGAITTTSQVINDRIDPDIDVDLYRFTATAGQIIDFDIDTALNGAGGLGSFLRLFNAQGTELDFNNDGRAPGESELGFDAYLRTEIQSTGTYYIGVSNVRNTAYNVTNGTGDATGGPSALGDYQLIIRAFPDDVGRTLSTAPLIGSITSSPITLIERIDPSNDVDLYRFTVTAGQIVDFDIDTSQNGSAGLGSYLRLFNSQGQQIAFNNDGAAPGESILGFDAYLRFTFATAGTYYIGVSNFNNVTYNASNGSGSTTGGTNATGDYQLIVQGLAVDTDDTLSEAIVVGAITTQPAVFSGSISTDVDVDMYRFTVTSGQIVDLDIDTPRNGPGGLGSYLRLFNSAGQELNFNDDGVAPGEERLGFDAYLRKLFLTAGTYTVGVSNFDNFEYNPLDGTGDRAGDANTIGNYTLTLAALPIDSDDTLSEAPLIGPLSNTPTLVTGSIETDIDVDIYRFAVTASGQVIDFDIDTVKNGVGGLGSYLRVFNNQGTEIAANNDAAAPGESTVGFDAYLRVTFPTNGTYYVAVSNNNNIAFNALTGEADNAGGFNSIGDYQLTILRVPPNTSGALTVSIDLNSISERNGTAVGTVTRDQTDLSSPLTVQLASSDITAATVPVRVVIPANATSADFEITAVDDSLLDGSQITTISASANNFLGGSRFLTVTDNERSFFNVGNPLDVNNDGKIEPLDALLVINILNVVGIGPIGNLEAQFPNEALFVNTNNDELISPLDALNVISSLNSESGEPEGAGLNNHLLGAFLNDQWAERVDEFFS